MNAIVPAEQQQSQQKLPTIAAGGAVRAIVPQDFDSAWRIATAVCSAGMAPKGLDTPPKAMVAIMHGLEIGLTPMNALQSIAVVNGRPTIWGDGAIGLARGSGLLEWMEEKFEGQDGTDGFTAVCIVKRKGEPKPTRGEFSIGDAKKAGLWGKAGPWQQYAKRMLKMRARAFTLRDGFADVLKGLSIREEQEDVERAAMRDVSPPSPPSPPEPPQIAVGDPPSPSRTASLPSPPAAPYEQPVDVEQAFASYEEALGAATDIPTLEEVWEANAPTFNDLGDSAYERAYAMYEKHVERVNA